MSDVAMALMKALGLSKESPTPAAALSPQEEAAPWLVPQGGGARPPGGRPQEVTMPQEEPNPNQAQMDVDALLRDIVKMKQKAAAAGGQPIPR